ncbi:integrase catalytic domain-containing protein [Trichonephila clavipes]|nr:integrase catalytic domain-containing protein [Trichonephila clavipes]
MQSEEKIKLSRSDIFPYPRECKQLAESQRSLPSANELFINEPNEICVLCLKNHPVRFCKRAFFIPLEEKNAIIKRKGLCRICLAKGHLASRCRSQITCQLCSKRHVKFMCPNIECNKSNSLKQDVNDKNINENTVDSLHSRATNEVILQTLVVNVHGIKRERKARAIIDTGSQKSYILRSTAEELGFNVQREEEFRHSLFGGTKTRMYKHKCYKIYLSSLDGNYICKLDALDHDVICNDISSAKNGSWIHELKTKNIFLTDIQENTGPIEVLLGADVAGKLITGRREELKTGLVALETKLGWTLMEDIPVSSLWDLEMLGIRDTIEQNSREEKAVMSHFLETVRQKEDGRYEVHMPWKVDRAFLTDNYELCLKRLESTTRKLEKIGFREKYHEVFREWLAEGVIEEIPGKELPVRTHYLPHRPVIKETSATYLQ